MKNSIYYFFESSCQNWKRRAFWPSGNHNKFFRKFLFHNKKQNIIPKCFRIFANNGKCLEDNENIAKQSKRVQHAKKFCFETLWYVKLLQSKRFANDLQNFSEVSNLSKMRKITKRKPKLKWMMSKKCFLNHATLKKNNYLKGTKPQKKSIVTC